MSLTEGILFGIVAMVTWGVSDFYLKKVTDKLGSLRTLFWLGVVQTIPLSFYFLLNLGTYSAIGNYLWLFILSVFLDFMGYLFFLKAVKKGSISIIAPVSSAWVIPAVIISIIFLNEIITTYQAIAISLTIVGIFLASIKFSDIKKMNLNKLLPGVPEDLISVMFFGVNLPLLGFLISKTNWFLPILFVRTGQMIIAFFYNVIKSQDLKIKGNVIMPLILAGLTSVAGFIAWSNGVNLQKVAIVTPIAAAFPFITVILARIFYKEKIELVQKLGIIGTVLGIILLSIV